MQRYASWMSGGILAILVLTLWGAWTWRLGRDNQHLTLELEAERQRSFSELAFHVEQLQALLAKGLAAGTVRQNMRFMGDVHHHAQAAISNFASLPLPPQTQTSTAKFLQQTGDFAVSLLRDEAAGDNMDARTRAELVRLRAGSVDLSTQLQTIATEYYQKGFRWHAPTPVTWATLVGRRSPAGKPNPGPQAPVSMADVGWEQVTTSMAELPVFLYDGPFSDHVDGRLPAMTGPPVAREDAAGRVHAYMPESSRYTVISVTDVNNNLPAHSFQLMPSGADVRAGAEGHSATVEVAKNGGYLVQLLNGRLTGQPTLVLAQARSIGQEYLGQIGYNSMVPTYGQIDGGAATIAYAYKENGVIVYPDQVKVKVALDNGEILAVDARQYLMSHHSRTLGEPGVTPQKAQEVLNPNLTVQKVQLALIPDPAGTGEILAYEFLTTLEDETFLVYINAHTAMEEQILLQVETDGGTFVL